MVSDQTGSHKADISNSKQMKAKEKNPTLSQLVTDDSNYNSSSNNNSVTARVCADCHTTKTPLWRTGPTGPKVNTSFIFPYTNSTSNFLFMKSI